jgi:hypothetical protein
MQVTLANSVNLDRLAAIGDCGVGSGTVLHHSSGRGMNNTSSGGKKGFAESRFSLGKIKG